MAQLSTADQALKDLLSEDEFNQLMAIRERKDQRAQRGQITETARALVAEGGKYGQEYGNANDVLTAIWEKAYNEASFEVTGINPEEDLVDEDDDEDDS